MKNVIHVLDIKREKIQLVMRNHHVASKDAATTPGDRVAMFPIEYPIYPLNILFTRIGRVFALNRHL